MGALAATLLCVAWAAPAAAKRPGPFSEPRLRTHPKTELRGGTPTPTATATATATRTATPTPTATATTEPTTTGTPTAGNAGLPNTGADPVRVAVAGLTLVGFGLALRLSLVDARRRPV